MSIVDGAGNVILGEGYQNPGGRNAPLFGAPAPAPPLGLVEQTMRDLGVSEADAREFLGLSNGSTSSGVNDPALGRDIFNYNQGRDDVGDQQWQENFDYREAQDVLDYALQTGDLELANRAQNSLDTWRGTQADLQREGNATTERGQDKSYQSAMAGVAQRGQAAQLQYQVGMANAGNDAERNVIQAAWNKTQAELQREEMVIRDRLGTQSNQTSQFGAETDRAVGMGGLALENNKFIAEMARSPRDLMGLYFMQRGITPDWDTMAAGGTPASMAALAPSGVMDAYTPGTAAPIFGAQASPATQLAAAQGVTAASAPAATAVAPTTAAATTPAAEAAPATRAVAPMTTMRRQVATVPPPAHPAGQAGLNMGQWGALPEYVRSQAESRARIQGLAAGGQATGRFIVGEQGPEVIDLGKRGNKPVANVTPISRDAMYSMLQGGTRGYALGTDDIQNQYLQAGLGASYLQSSDNQHLQGQVLPQRLQMLAAQGMPIAPSLAAATTGQIAPNLNVAQAATQRGIGVLPSLQTFARQTKGETDLYRGFAEGVGGMPWADILDGIMKPTQGLQKAARARAA